jgi:hypothetical protein
MALAYNTLLSSMHCLHAVPVQRDRLSVMHVVLPRPLSWKPWMPLPARLQLADNSCLAHIGEA